MDPYDPARGLIRRVLFVACSDAVARELKGVIGDRDGFVLERYEHFLSRLYSPPPSAPPISSAPPKAKGKSSARDLARMRWPMRWAEWPPS